MSRWCEWPGCTDPATEDASTLGGAFSVHRHHLDRPVAQPTAEELAVRGYPPPGVDPFLDALCRASNLSDQEVRTVEDDVVLDLVVGLEILGLAVMSEYQIDQHNHELAEGMTDVYHDWLRNRHYLVERDADERLTPLHPIDQHCPEQGLVWSPSRKMRNALETIEVLEGRGTIDELLIDRYRPAGSDRVTHCIRATGRNERHTLEVGVNDTRLDRGLVRAAILINRL